MLESDMFWGLAFAILSTSTNTYIDYTKLYKLFI